MHIKFERAATIHINHVFLLVQFVWNQTLCFLVFSTRARLRDESKFLS